MKLFLKEAIYSALNELSGAIDNCDLPLQGVLENATK